MPEQIGRCRYCETENDISELDVFNGEVRVRCSECREVFFVDVE